MLKFAAKLPDDYEYAIVCAPNQSQAFPQGQQSDGKAELPELRLGFAGDDITISALTGASAGGTEEIVISAITVVPGDNAWVGAELRVGRPGAPSVGYGTVVANYLDGATLKFLVTWTKAAAAGASVSAYLVYRDCRHSSYPNVRVLTPFLPDQGGPYVDGTPLEIPGQTVDPSITDIEDLATFLPFSHLEGVVGYGVTEEDEIATGATANSLTFNSAILTAGVLAGGYVRVEHAEGVSWSAIGDNTTTQLTGLSWSGAGTPSGTASAWKIEAWLQHYFDNPHAYLPGPGFRYPSHLAGVPYGAVYNNPRGNANWGWLQTRFGLWLPFAWALSNALGVRINLIPLAVPASSIMITGTLFGSASPHGWYGPQVRCDWNPSTPVGLAARVKRLINMAGKANAADGNTKPLRILGVCGFQGEAEAASTFGRTAYKNLLPMFHSWLRNVIHDSGLSFYPLPEQIPVMHSRIQSEPWELAVSDGGAGDTEGEVNGAIDDLAAKVQFAGTINTDGLGTWDGIHYDGTSEAIVGKRAAAEMTALIDAAVSGVDVDLSHPMIAEVCNVALTSIGAKARIANLQTDQSEEGSRCRRFYPVARKMLLQRCSWSFATRRTELAAVTDARTEEWAYAYGIPDNSVRVFAVLPPNAGDDVSVHGASGAISRSTTGLYTAGDIVTGYTPQKFTVEQTADGHQVIYTNVENAVARYNVLVTDVTQYSPQFLHALSMQIAALLAGTTIRSEDGTFIAQALTGQVERSLGEAKMTDAVQHNPKPQQVVSWMAARRGVRE